MPARRSIVTIMIMAGCLAAAPMQSVRLLVGATAPDFTLPTLAAALNPTGAQTTVTLSSFKGKKPVVLLFSSYT